MFEIPDAKRVRREDLYSSASSDADDASQADEQDETVALQALSSLLGLDLGEIQQPKETSTEQDATADHDRPENADKEAEEEFAFRLFSTSAPSQKVVLADEEAADPSQEGGPPIKLRPVSFYLRGEPTAEQKEQFRQAAVSGAEVKAAAGLRAWGLEVPWRVTKITLVATRQKGNAGKDGTERKLESEKKEGEKKRPGKKRRIVLRKREAARKEAEKDKEKQALTKEEHLKEKKKRLNRERKLKRRAKEKEKKMAGPAGGGVIGEAEGAGGESDGDSE